MPARPELSARIVLSPGWSATEGECFGRAMKLLMGFASVIALVLMWLALDDITTGAEPNLVGEWSVVLAGAGWFVVLAIWLAKRGRHG